MLNVLSDKIRNALGMGIQLDVALPDELPVEEPIQRTGSGMYRNFVIVISLYLL